MNMQVVFFREPTERNDATRKIGTLAGLRPIEAMADSNGFFNPSATGQLERKFNRLKINFRPQAQAPSNKAYFSPIFIESAEGKADRRKRKQVFYSTFRRNVSTMCPKV